MGKVLVVTIDKVRLPVGCKMVKKREIAIGCDDAVGCNHGLAVVVGGFKMLALIKEIYLGG